MIEIAPLNGLAQNLAAKLRMTHTLGLLELLGSGELQYSPSMPIRKVIDSTR